MAYTAEERGILNLREEIFTQQLIELIFVKVCNLRMPFKLNEQPSTLFDVTSPLTENIVKAILILNFDVRNDDEFIYTSTYNNIRGNKVTAKYGVKIFLKFISNYLLRATKEYLENVEDSPFEFYTSISRFLKITREYEGDSFFTLLNTDEATVILNFKSKFVLLVKSLNLKFRSERIPEERMFILDTMILIYKLKNTQLPSYLLALRMALNKVYEEETTKNLMTYRNQIFTKEIEYYISSTYSTDFHMLCNTQDFIQICYDRLHRRIFNEHAFMLFCIFFTRRAILSPENNNSLNPLKAFILIVCLFEYAVNEKLISLNGLVQCGKVVANRLLSVTTVYKCGIKTSR